jgi:hypothetical protein
MLLSNVSRTAIYTLIIHDLIAKKNITNDPQSTNCLKNLYGISSPDEKKQIDKMKKSLSGLGYLNSVLPPRLRCVAGTLLGPSDTFCSVTVSACA